MSILVAQEVDVDSLSLNSLPAASRVVQLPGGVQALVAAVSAGAVCSVIFSPRMCPQKYTKSICTISPAQGLQQGPPSASRALKNHNQALVPPRGVMDQHCFMFSSFAAEEMPVNLGRRESEKARTLLLFDPGQARSHAPS